MYSQKHWLRRVWLRLAICLALALVGIGSGLPDRASAAPPTAPLAQTLSISVNFQNETATPPAGYLRDFGEPYGVRSAADQGGGAYTYGWVDPTTGNPLDLTGGSNGNGRDRGTSQPDQRLDSLVHMQGDDITVDGDNFSGVDTEGIWEIDVPNGAYNVTVAAGDPNENNYANDPEFHALNVEGAEAIFGFAPPGNEGSNDQHQTATVQVGVVDGKLTIDAFGGTNTKINYVDIVSIDDEPPFVTTVFPENRATDVDPTDGAVGADISVPQAGCGVEPTSLSGNVHLYEVNADGSNGAEVPTTTGSSGGNDIITIDPNGDLAPFTTYRFVVTSGVLSEQDGGTCADGGDSFLPFSSLFTTGEEETGGGGGTFEPVENAEFDVIDLNISSIFFTTLTMGPDGKLYGATNTGEIRRYTVNSDGTLSNEEILTGVSGNGPRLLIGMVFDENATANDPVVWVTHTVFGFNNVGERWGGKVSRLSGPNLGTVQDVFINLPRSAKDHVTNSITYGPDGNLYFLQGSNLAAGHPDSAWGSRPETLLTAAVLTFDPDQVMGMSLPIDVKTGEAWDGGGESGADTSTGSYDPFAPGAPLQVFTSGVRNAYDLLWHSNGYLYVPTNGTAGGGQSPSFDPNDPAFDYCANVRLDGLGRTQIPAVEGVNSSNPDSGQKSHEKQRDFVFISDGNGGGYYGHPNPARCEWVLNIGNPLADTDEPGEGQGGSNYDVGTQPDPNYQGYPNNTGTALDGAVWDMEFNKSPNGIIEYQSNNFGGELQGRVMIVRFSNNNDIYTMQVDSDGTVLGAQAGSAIPGFGTAPGQPYNDPLELTENPATGDIYLAQYDRGGGNQKLWLLRPTDRNAPDDPNIEAAPAGLVFDQITSDGQSAPQIVTVSNSGAANLTISSVSLLGADAGDFVLPNPPAANTNVAPGGTLNIDVAFDPGSNGPKEATLRISSNDPDTPDFDIELDGLGENGNGGANEPSLQWILDTLDIPVNVGDNDPSTNIMGANDADANAPLLGEEISAQLFEKAGSGDVTVDLLAVYGPTANDPVTAFGWYAAGSPGTTNELFTVSNNPTNNGQRVLPVLSGSTSFDPGSGSFGIYSRWPFFGNRLVYSQDALNTFDSTYQHKVRVYPLKDEGGNVVPNAYVVATEEHTSGFDFQDIVVILRNVVPAQPPVTGECNPISTLECEDVPVTLPYVLGFNSDQGGLLSGNGIGTGFTMVDPPSARLSVDDPVFNSNVPGYEPSNLTLDTGAGTLSIVSTKGIQYARPSGPGVSSTETNSQINALGVGFDMNSPVRIESTATSVPLLPGNNFQQFGLWFGLDEDHYVKVSYLNSNNGEARVQLAVETIDPGSGELTFEQVDGPTFAQSSVSQVSLAMQVDPVTNQVTAFYSLNGGAEQQVSGGGFDSLPIPASFSAGVDHDNAGGTAPLSYAGVFATQRRADASAPITVAFSDFSVSPLAGDEEAPTVSIDVTGNQDGNGDYVGSASVTINAADTGGSGVASVEYSFDGGTTWFPYGGPFTISDSGSYVINAQATDGAGNVGTAQPVSIDIIAIESGDIALTNLDWQFPSGVTEAGREHFDSWLAFNRHQTNRNSNDENYGEHDLATLRISNESGSEELQIFGFNLVGNNSGVTGNPAFTLPGGEESLASPIVVQPGAFYDLDVQFIYSRSTDANNENVFAELEISSSDPVSPTVSVGLGGTWQWQREGGNEPNVAEIVEAFGFSTTIVEPGQQINNQGRIETIGEEILSPFWRRANTSEPIFVRQLAAFHSCCPNTATVFLQPDINSGGTNSILTHEGDDGQSYLPRKNNQQNPGQGTITPPNELFGFKIDPEWSDPSRNNKSPDDCSGGNDTCGHHVRFWPARDLNGDVIPNAFIMVMDYAGINYDFNDNVYYLSNIEPQNVPTDLAITKEASADPAGVNTDLDYIITVTNNESVYAAPDVVVTDDLPDGVNFVSASAGCTENGGIVTCDLGDVDPGATVELIITVQPTAQGELVNSATVTSGDFSASDSVTVDVIDPNNLPGTVTIIKEATPESEQLFSFSGDLGTFDLVDNGGTTSGDSWSYNFQLAGVPVPAGYTPDVGAPYGAQPNGETFGWRTTAADAPIDAGDAMRDRDRSGIPQELDTLVHLERADCCDSGFLDEIYWSHALPAGSYEITLSFGDQPGQGDVYDSQHQVTVEGTPVPATPFQATAQQEYLQQTVTVDVTDGELTVAPTAAGTNTKLNYIEIVSLAAPNEITFSNVAPGTYSVTETLPDGWQLTGIVCSDGDSTSSGTTATINLAPQENVTCTFNNTNDPQENAQLNGNATLQGRSDHSADLDVKLYGVGASTPTYEFTVASDAAGNFTLPNVAAGTYEVAVKSSNSLQSVETVTLVEGANSASFGELPAGDANDDNFVEALDFSILASSFNTAAGSPGFDARADFNGDGFVEATDFSLLATNFNVQGEEVSGADAQAQAALRRTGPTASGTAILHAQTDITALAAGQEFQVTLVLDVQAQTVDTVSSVLRFDPARLQVLEIVPGGPLDTVLASSFDNATGQLRHEVGKLGRPFPGGSFPVVTIRFRSLVDGTNAGLFFQGSTQVYRAGVNVLRGLKLDEILLPVLDQETFLPVASQ